MQQREVQPGGSGREAKGIRYVQPPSWMNYNTALVSDPELTVLSLDYAVSKLLP